MEKENTKRIISSETISSMKLRLYRNTHHISPNRFYVFNENQLLGLVAMATLGFHTLIMGKIEKWYLLPSHCRYFNKSFIEMFLEKSSISCVCFGSFVGVTSLR